MGKVRDIYAGKRQHLFRDLPGLVKEIRVDHLPRSFVVRLRGDIDDRPVGQFGILQRVGAVVVFPEGDDRVEDEVFFGIQRIRVDQNRNVRRGGESFFTDTDLKVRGAQR